MPTATSCSWGSMDFEQKPMMSTGQLLEPTAKAVQTLCGVRVLIVDDNPEVLLLASRMVHYLGCQTTTAEDALMALYYLRKGRFDVVISDYDMPFMDGYELADQIKETYFGTKVIMMTCHCEADVMDMIRESNIVDGLLLKPFNMQAIQKTIENAL